MTTLTESIHNAIARNEGSMRLDASQWQVCKLLEDCFAPAPVKDRKHRRKAVTLYLIGKSSTKDMTGAELEGLLDWLTRRKVGHVDGALHEDAVKEARSIYTEALRAEGQMELV